MYTLVWSQRNDFDVEKGEKDEDFVDVFLNKS